MRNARCLLDPKVATIETLVQFCVNSMSFVITNYSIDA